MTWTLLFTLVFWLIFGVAYYALARVPLQRARAQDETPPRFTTSGDYHG